MLLKSLILGTQEHIKGEVGMARIRMSDLTRKRQFLIAAVTVRNESHGISVDIPEDPYVFINGSGRKIISDPNGDFAKDGFYRWAAGGTLIILNQGSKRYVPLILRDGGAPSYANHVTLASGLSDDYSDWFNPTNIALREGFEEIAILVNNEHIIPVIMQEHEELFWKINNSQKRRLQKLDVHPQQQLSVRYRQSRLVETGKDQTLRVCSEYRVSEHHGIVWVDENTRGIDLIKVAELDMPEGQISMVDCENTKGGPLDREIILFDLDKLVLCEDKVTPEILGAVVRYKSGVSSAISPTKFFHVVPHTANALKAIL